MTVQETERICLVALDSCKHYDKQTGKCNFDGFCEFKRERGRKYTGKYKLAKFWK